MKKRKVGVFSSTYEENLELQINNFLERFNVKSVIDIKYNVVVDSHNKVTYSALVHIEY